MIQGQIIKHILNLYKNYMKGQSIKTTKNAPCIIDSYKPKLRIKILLSLCLDTSKI